MRIRPLQSRQFRVSAIVVLAALLFRAYIPVGFMPAAGAPFRLELCPASGTPVPAHHCTITIRSIMRIFRIAPSAACPLKGRFPTS